MLDGYIGIDLGTSGCRACVISRAGDILAEASTSLPASKSPKPHYFEQNPADWWQATVDVLDRILPKRRFTPRAISVDGTSATLLICDHQGKPLTPGLMYNDSRAMQAALKLRDLAPPDSVVHSASSALAKLIHLSGQGRFAQATHALHQADWISGQLSGLFGYTDESNALKLGYDPVRRCWPDWLKRIQPVKRLLPEVIPVGSPSGHLQQQWQQRWRCTKPIQIVAGTTDSNAATLAAGIHQIGDAVTSLGSTLVLKILSAQPLFCAEYGIYSHRMYDHWLVGGASNSGGQVLAQYFNPAQIARLSRQIDPRQPGGLDYYPLVCPGERFPLNDPALAPRLQPRPPNDVLFLQGMLEGIAQIERLGYQRLHELGAPYPKRIFSSGGGSHNPIWHEIRRQWLKAPLMQAMHTEAAYGSALIAAGNV